MKLLLVLMMLATGCGKQGNQGPQGVQGNPGQPGRSCTIEFSVIDNPVKSGVIHGVLTTCTDGSIQFLPLPTQPEERD